MSTNEMPARIVTTGERKVARPPENETIGLLKRATKYTGYVPRVQPDSSARPVRLTAPLWGPARPARTSIATVRGALGPNV